MINGIALKKEKPFSDFSLNLKGKLLKL